MKEIQITQFQAFDGKRFDTASQCRTHEANSLPQRLAGLTPEQVARGLDRSDPELADAYERAGMGVRALRRKAGEFKRTPSEKTDAHAPEIVAT